MRLTTLFAHDAKAGSYVRSLFFIDPAGLTFVDGPDGRRDADLTLLLLGIGDNGRASARPGCTCRCGSTPTAYQLLQQRGLLYSARLPMKKPGGYQIRAAVQDARSKAVGSSAQFVEVPKVGKGQIALSGVVMMDVASAPPAGAHPRRPWRPTRSSDGVLGEPAVKIFRPGPEVAYTCEIYDGGKGSAEGFATTATLLRDGRPFFSSPPAAGQGRGDRRRGAQRAGRRPALARRRSCRAAATPCRSPWRRAARGAPQATQWVEFEVR